MKLDESTGKVGTCTCHKKKFKKLPRTALQRERGVAEARYYKCCDRYVEL